MSPTVVSSPGKVLVAGGYLVLDPTYSGIVVSTSSRFYTVIQSSSTGPTIHVRSPQFQNASWSYSVSFKPSVLVEASPQNSSKNKFVHLALQNTISLACEARGTSTISQILSEGLDVAIVGDNDFYSQRANLESLNLPRSLNSLKSLQPFSRQDVPLPEVHKTGLGSSAALITSLVSSILYHLGVISQSAFENESSEERHLAHNISQYVHCLAQGKVGSGFDVAAAVYGSHIYTRFDPGVLQELMADDMINTRPLLPTLSPSNKAWNHRVTPFSLPPLTRLLLADIDAGSDTPSLVGKVLSWRSQDTAKAHALWTAIDQHNSALARTLNQLTELCSRDPANYSRTVKYLSSLQPLQWTADPSLSDEETIVASAFHEVHEITQMIRDRMRKMGQLADVPIEPTKQTELLDMCVSQAGVIGGGVPGAGGYDAIWLLVCDPDESLPDQWPGPSDRIDYLWTNYEGVNVSPLSAMESKTKGIQLETLDQVGGLKDAITILS
ncbi:phosphomevalonate kinase [Moniliophthora roreri]|uniref:Phosphomevalonate kinase n=1 Tax=Moniliophthora roreri TaxID=221103 RepID=A0A0W0FGY0_MONRR|nr:phosphomevalonate kinase [Moniliophthora roreri]